MTIMRRDRPPPPGALTAPARVVLPAPQKTLRRGYLLLDPRGRIIEATPVAARHLGFDPREMEGRYLVDLVHPDDRRQARRYLLQAPGSDGEGDARWDLRIIGRSEASGWVTQLAHCTQGPDGAPALQVFGAKVAPARLRQIGRVIRRRSSVRDTPYSLTNRELDILRLMAAGCPDKEIGVLLGISAHTTSKHAAHIMKKMGAHSRAQAVACAIREGIME